MAEIKSLIDGLWPLGNRCAARDGKLLGFTVIEAKSASFVLASKVWKKLPGFLVDELIDRFMTNAELGMIEANPSGDLFRRP